MAAVSNGRYLPVTQPAPYAGAGWQVKVLSYAAFEARKATGGPGVPLFTVPTYVNVTLSPTLSHEGAGAVTLDLDADFWRLPLADGQPSRMLLLREHIWQGFEDGKLIWEFLGQTKSYAAVPSSGRRAMRTVTMAGPGLADVLRWGTVMTPNYPRAATVGVPGSGAHRFTNTPMMGVWLKLLTACHRRGTLRFVSPRFGQRVDTAGQRWQDLRPPPPRTPPRDTSTVASDELFGPDLNSYTLTPSGQVRLSGVAAQFHGPKPRVSIVVHCDWTASRAYNQTLSSQQAAACKAYLQGIKPAAIITARGYGETRPVASNRTAAGRKRNRRTVISYPARPKVADSTYAPPLGTNLLDLLKEFSGADPAQPSSLRLEWYVHPGFVIDVRRQFGRRREKHVIFHEGSTATLGKDVTFTTAELANLVAVQNEAGDYAVANHPVSIRLWRQREQYLRLEGTYDTTARRQIASAALRLAAFGRHTVALKVAAAAPGRRVFRDYQLGDWIGVAFNDGGAQLNTVEPYRVMAITVSVSGGGAVDVELELQSWREAWRSKLTAALNSLVAHRRGVRIFVRDDEPLAAVEGDLWTRRNPA